MAANLDDSISPINYEDHLLADILSRLDETSLARARCVCKLWHRVICCTSYFLRLRVARPRRLKFLAFWGPMFEEMVDNPVTFQTSSVDISKPAATTDDAPVVRCIRAPEPSPEQLVHRFGEPSLLRLLFGSMQEFVVIEREPGLYLFYPSTQKIRRLPDPSPRFDEDDYPLDRQLIGATHDKLFRFFYKPDAPERCRNKDDFGEYPGPMSCEVLTLHPSGATASAWREVAPPPFNIHGNVVCVDGVVYGLARYIAFQDVDEILDSGITGPPEDKPILLAFHMAEEEFRPLHHPQALIGPNRPNRWLQLYDDNLELTPFDGMLGLLDYYRNAGDNIDRPFFTRLDIWLLMTSEEEDYHGGRCQGVWERRYVIDPHYGRLRPVGLTNDGHVLLCRYDRHQFFKSYDPKTKKFSTLIPNMGVDHLLEFSIGRATIFRRVNTVAPFLALSSCL